MDKQDEFVSLGFRGRRGEESLIITVIRVPYEGHLKFYGAFEGNFDVSGILATLHRD